jgi:Signal transduction histidine kinase
VSIGLPAHLMASTSSRSFVRASHAIAITCLAIAILTVLVFQADRPGLLLWPAGVAVLPMLALLLASARRTTAFYSVAYLVVGGASTYWYAVTFFSQLDAVVYRDVFSLALLHIALLMVGGPGVSLASGLAWSGTGLVIAELASALASAQTGHGIVLEAVTVIVFAGTAAVLLSNTLARRRWRTTPPRLHRAARDEHLANLRYRVELKAAALLHDTILSHLAAVADSTGSLNGDLRAQVERDLEVLVGEEWLSPPADADAQAQADWRHSELFAAVAESRALGLEIEVTGDPACLARLAPESSRALGLAAKQCLVNVLKHSGTAHAELAVYASSADVSVMIVDTGRGFDAERVAPDRFGLRASVQERIEEVGGSVKIFSTLGRGTSVMIRVPVALGARTTVSIESA